MAARDVDGGLEATRLVEEDEAVRLRRHDAARNVVSGLVVDALGLRGEKEGSQSPELQVAKRIRRELYEMLGIEETADDAPAVEPAAPNPQPVRPAPPAKSDKPSEGRVVAKVPLRCPDDDWRRRGACRDENPELHFPIGTSGPALLQVEQAKAVCRRCSVTDDCLAWALAKNQEFGVWGGMSEEERRALKRRGGLKAAARAA